MTPRNLSVYGQVWSAEKNEEIYMRYLEFQARKRDIGPIPDFTGDFNTDYRAVCSQLKIACHPQLVNKEIKREPKKEEKEDKEDLSVKGGSKSSVRAKKGKPVEEEEKVSSIVENLQIYGWNFDVGTAAALKEVLPGVRSLTSLRLWGAAAKPKALRLLADGLKDSTIQRLYLEFNPINEEDDSKQSVRPMFVDTARLSTREVIPDGDETQRDGPMTSRPGTGGPMASRPLTGGVIETLENSRPGSRGDYARSRPSSQPAIAESAFQIAIGEGDRLSCLVPLCSSPNLQTICLRSNKIADRAAKQLFVALQEHKSILSLNLWDNCIGDDAMPELVNFLMLTKTLVALAIGRNKLTTTGAAELATAFKAIVVDKEEAKKLKKDGIAVTVTKSRAFRDANATVRLLNVSDSQFNDQTCELFLELADEDTSSGLTGVTEGKEGGKGAKKKAAKAEHGKGNKLERIIITHNPCSLDMQIKLYLEEKIECDQLPREVLEKLEAEAAARDPDAEKPHLDGHSDQEHSDA